MSQRMQIFPDGAQRFAGAAVDLLDILRRLPWPTGRAGRRIAELEPVRKAFGGDDPVGAIAHDLIGPGAMLVRAILFDKTSDANWSLDWHQDRTICVRERCDVPGFGPWTTKAGIVHVSPPIEILARMFTLRVHLDPVDGDNAPLRISPGTHRLGMIEEPRIARTVAHHGHFDCLAEAGDVWAYSTPILHASKASTGSRGAGSCNSTSAATRCRRGSTGCSGQCGAVETLGATACPTSRAADRARVIAPEHGAA